MPDITKAQDRFSYLGGGGASATAIGRAIRYYNEGAHKSIPGGFDNVNLVSPFDDGGSSRDQQAIRKAYGSSVPSPGDIAAVMSWQVVQNKDWYADANNYTIPGYSPEMRNAIFN